MRKKRYEYGVTICKKFKYALIKKRYKFEVFDQAKEIVERYIKKHKWTITKYEESEFIDHPYPSYLTWRWISNKGYIQIYELNRRKQ